MRTKFYPSVNCFFLPVQKQRNKEVSGFCHYYTYAGTIIILTCVMILLCLHNYSYNVCYNYFIITKYVAEQLNQNYDNMCCVPGVTGTTGTKFYTQHTRFNLPK